MGHSDVWDSETARTYDTPGAGMFDPELVARTADRLAALAGKGRALEFAIGTGRVAIPLRERGVEVVGIELSAAMVDQLRTKVDEATIPVVVGDMATATASGRFSLVYLVYNSIGNIVTQEGQVACFRNAARHLQPGGRFVVELGVPGLRILPPGQDGLVFQAVPGYIGVDTYDVINQRLVSHHFRFDGDGKATLGRTAQRYIWPAEMDLMGQLAGFELEERWADWTGAPFTAESASHVSVYRLTDR